MKAMTFDKSFAEKKDTFANLIANLSRMVLTTSERLFYIKLLTRGFRSTPMYKVVQIYTYTYNIYIYILFRHYEILIRSRHLFFFTLGTGTVQLYCLVKWLEN